jgi:hypothetical protein
MKYCPVCSERYDEEIIRLCTKDGTPLVDEVQPSFTAMPSESIEVPDDDVGQETVIRLKPLVPEAPPIAIDTQGQSERIVIPTSQEQEPQVRARTAQGYVVPPPPPNTARTVFLTILGTLFALGIGSIVFWFLQKDTPANVNANINANANQNTNLNTNLGFDSNFNFNANVNSNLNLNTNVTPIANLVTNTNTTTRPTPTPPARPSPTPVPTPGSTPSNSATPRPPANIRPPANTSPTPVGTPRIGPRPPPLANRPPGNANG